MKITNQTTYHQLFLKHNYSTTQTLLVLQLAFLSLVDSSVYILFVAYLQTLERQEGNVKGMSREFREV